jgi:hypothetical protein
LRISDVSTAPRFENVALRTGFSIVADSSVSPATAGVGAAAESVAGAARPSSGRRRCSRR